LESARIRALPSLIALLVGIGTSQQ
jgi:hypothetical protein